MRHSGTFLNLIDRFYAAALDDALWEPALRAMADALGSSLPIAGGEDAAPG